MNFPYGIFTANSIIIDDNNISPPVQTGQWFLPPACGLNYRWKVSSYINENPTHMTTPVHTLSDDPTLPPLSLSLTLTFEVLFIFVNV